ncbi:hypothetical protein [Paraburkholderia sp. ZP32-5]|uniref:hypothetical protein n=1 Tax=Paraburkholderia sp. ZP32-5 TaxID=2883245 RepID=UPI001F465D7B|nr:hypothetical protein [Paraburkholderia sp. ZP32-5]
MPFRIAEATMWQLVQRHTGRVGYRRGVKAEGLSATPAVIDCSGWVALLLNDAMQAENEAASRPLFRADDIRALHTWSDRIIEAIETRTAFVLAGPQIATHNLPRCATLGLKMGEPAWANNHPRPRGITHIVQVVRRPEDDAPFVSESFGGSAAPGIGLTPLAEWLARMQPYLCSGAMWAVDPFRLADDAAPPP